MWYLLITIFLVLQLVHARPVKRGCTSTVSELSTATIYESVDLDHSLTTTLTAIPTAVSSSQSSEDSSTSDSSSSPYTQTIPTAEAVTITVGQPLAAATLQDIVGDDSADYEVYASPILMQHNIHRQNHSVPELVWNTTLAGWANELAQKCNYTHSNEQGDGHYGQNIGAGWLAKDVNSMIGDAMYNDQIIWYPGYGTEPQDNGHDWGHFTQIIWKDSSSVGCATKICDHLEGVEENVPPWFTVCNYYPQGMITLLSPVELLSLTESRKYKPLVHRERASTKQRVGDGVLQAFYGKRAPQELSLPR
jgi:uncharacterized protein YkwD